MEAASQITALILAGGFGTRLQSVVSDRPKVLAEVSGRPFLAYLLDQLSSAGFRTVVISTGHMAQAVEKCFGDRHGPLSILYSREEEPLGTAGAVRLALANLASATVLVMNGDSYIDADLGAYVNWFGERDRQAALLLVKVADTSRYGSVRLDRDKVIVSFEEKSKIAEPGWINAGVYLLKKPLIAAIEPGKCCSLERDFFPGLAGKGLFGFCVERRFIDIGTPQAYASAEEFFHSAGTENPVSTHREPGSPSV